MNLILVRHGDAKSRGEDPQRGLTPEGVRLIEAVAALLKTKPLSPTAVWHSGKKRAEQTAHIIDQMLCTKEGVLKQSGLAPDDPTAPMLKKIGTLCDDLILVSHLPFVGKFTEALLGEAEGENRIAFFPGTAVCLTQSRSNGWQLAWTTNR